MKIVVLVSIVFVMMSFWKVCFDSFVSISIHSLLDIPNLDLCDIDYGDMSFASTSVIKATGM